MVQLSTLDRTLHAVADPTRRVILERLADGPASVSELARPLAMSLPGLLKHVRILEEAQLVQTHKNGRTRECRLGPRDLGDAIDWMQTFRARWDSRLDRLDTYLAKNKGE
jgi:DNA-binding transcriptional ArsR family regulator